MAKRILVIDDEKMMLRLVQSILSRAGYEVFTAETVDQALTCLEAQPFDLITCDLMLPGTSGLDFLEMMKTGEIQPARPVIVVTAAGFQAELDEARRSGAAEILIKPFTSTQLVELVSRVLKPDS